MVSPDDVGRYAAALLSRPDGESEIRHVEGPQRYSSADVARAFAKLLGKTVGLANIPRERWREAYVQFGFSPEAAQSYERMTATTLETEFPPVDKVIQGSATLEQYVAQLLKRSESSGPDAVAYGRPKQRQCATASSCARASSGARHKRSNLKRRSRRIAYAAAGDGL